LRPFHYPLNLLRSSLLGAVLGALPGIGMTAASFLAYNEAKRAPKDKTPFGEGNEEGVIAPECANIATTGGALIPALTLGIPGSESTAVFLTALFIQGIKPGFDLFQKHPDVLFALTSGMVIACIMMVVFGTVGIPLFSKVTLVPSKILMPILIPLTFIGAYATHNDMTDVSVALVIAVVGYFLKEYGYSVIAMLMAFILTPIIEQNYQRAIDITGHNYFQAFFTGWLSWTLIVITAASLAFMIWRELRDRKKNEDTSGAFVEDEAVV
ncbi:MAG: tripartite tricarboxylate transporter permease, partial [Alicyclobacillus sp.]|nr:tripartite tricarboxylate transporter permease [Alicyclobacillus sp.]